ncbi:hypothetical protein [Clostridium cadaveris]|uniref:hypothetical protein n=1 Tax=Clostridium cadaveris TaxID=1529 RepID=UPI0015B604EE|nr:hypothetical protein [Clostridium cadaveris]NWK10751.1 hypothetical protein [Clostridium cadaveris]
MIKIASIGDQPQKDDILALLKITTVRFEKTGQFATQKEVSVKKLPPAFIEIKTAAK